MKKNIEEIFAHVLQIPVGLVVDDLGYEDVQSWDSIGHMGIISAIEETYNIVISPDDILNIANFKSAKEIVGKYL